MTFTVLAAWRTVPHFTVGKGSRGSNNAAAINGRRYERQVIAELDRWAVVNGAKLEHNPWFEYNNGSGIRICSPDGLLRLASDKIIVAEIKLTYVPEAIIKLRELYCPVVATALKCEAVPLVIVKNLIPDAPPATDRLGMALSAKMPLLQWLGHGRIVW